MATVVFIRESKQGLAAMKAVMQYCMQPGKVTDPVSGRVLISGVNCDGENSVQEFLTTKTAYRKLDGTNFYHYTQSFRSWDEVSAVKAQEIALDFAARAWPGHEVLVCTHCDTDNPHSHFVVNSVAFADGHKLRQDPHTLETLRQLSDEICLAHGLPVLRQTDGAKLSSREFRAAQKKQSWKFQLMVTVDQVMESAGSREEFLAAMRRRGYELTWTPERKYITFHCPNGMKVRDIKLHNQKYLKENLENEFIIRKQRTDQLLRGCSPAVQPGERGDLRSHSVPTHRLRDTRGAEADGIRAAPEGGGISADAVSDAGAAGYEGGAPELHYGSAERRDAGHGTDSGRTGDGQQPDRGGAGAEHPTGWEAAREIYLRQLLTAGYPRQRAGRRDRFPAREAAPHPDLDLGVGGRALGLGLGGLVAAAELSDSDEDPEEQRRRIEAEQSAKNLGAALGLMAGAVLAATQKESPAEEEINQANQQQTMSV